MTNEEKLSGCSTDETYPGWTPAMGCCKAPAVRVCSFGEDGRGNGCLLMSGHGGGHVVIEDSDDDDDDCTCIEYCDEDQKTKCSLSGIQHVHPEDLTHPGAYGPCPIHPGRPGDQ